MKLQKSIVALFALILFAVSANAQFGDLMNKAKNKIDKGQKKVGQTTQTGDSNQSAPTGDNAASNSGARLQTGARKPGETGFVGFSKKPIDPNNLSAAQFTNSFANGEPVYGIAYLPQPLSAYVQLGDTDVNKKDTIFAMFYTKSEFPGATDFDMETRLQARITVTPEMMNQKTVAFAVFPDTKLSITPSEGMSGYNNVKYFIENGYTKAKQYDVQLKFTISGSNEVVASQPISIDLSNKAPYLAMKNSYNKALAGAMIAKASDKPLEPAATSNAALQKQFSSLAQSQLGDGKLLKMNILNPSWQVVRNEITGVITHRYMSARGIVKEGEGYCRTRYVLFTQSYNGTGYGSTQVNASGATDDWVIPCERAK